jgi:hypothetical protein
MQGTTPAIAIQYFYTKDYTATTLTTGQHKMFH